MKKAYLVSTDEYSGQVVITCETREIEIDTYKPTADQLLAAQYLYRSLPTQIEKKTQYIVKIFYHYELGENAYLPDGDGATNLLECWKTLDKTEANNLFKAAVQFTK